MTKIKYYLGGLLLASIFIFYYIFILILYVLKLFLPNNKTLNNLLSIYKNGKEK